MYLLLQEIFLGRVSINGGWVWEDMQEMLWREIESKAIVSKAVLSSPKVIQDSYYNLLEPRNSFTFMTSTANNFLFFTAYKWISTSHGSHSAPAISKKKVFTGENNKPPDVCVTDINNSRSNFNYQLKQPWKKRVLEIYRLMTKLNLQ